jgi:uncharacterized protein YunC (DUF1805 family)
MIASEQTVKVGEAEVTGVRVALPGAPVLMLVGAKGFVGCGYFRPEVADRVGHALAVVTGVKSFDDMLAADVKAVSAAAAALGIAPGMSGRAAAALLA